MSDKDRERVPTAAELLARVIPTTGSRLNIRVEPKATDLSRVIPKRRQVRVAEGEAKKG